MTLLDDVDAWCRINLRPRPAARPTHLLNVRPTAAELAAHPGDLSIAAYFAGARHALGYEPQRFPRPLTDVEAESWTDGWAEERADQPAARRQVPVDSARPLLALEAS